MIDVQSIPQADMATLRKLTAEIERLRLEHPGKIVTLFIVAQAVASLTPEGT